MAVSETQVTETFSEGLKRGYTVVVPAADIESRRSKRLAEIGKTVKMPGFRPGKVPMPVIKQRYGTAVSAEVLEESVNAATRQVMTDRGLRPASQPKVDVVSLGSPTGGEPAGASSDLEFKVELELLPDIAMPDFSAIALTRMRAEPSPEAVDRALTEIATRNRDLVDVEEARPAAKGDVLVVDFLGKIDGIAFPGGAGTDTQVEIGGTGFIPGFSEQLEGLSPGEERVIEVTFPDEYNAKELAGKPATFEIKAKALKSPVIPAIDDELGKKLGFEGLDRVRELITQQIQREFDQLGRQRIKRDLLDALSKVADFPIPQGMVEAEFAQIWQRVEASKTEGQADAEDAGKDDDTLKAEYRAIAERRVRLGLLLSEIGRVNGVVVAPEEMTRAMRTEAGRYPGQEAQVMEFFKKNPQAAENLRAPIFEDKVVDFVLELAKVADRTVTPEELARDPEAVPAETKAVETPAEAGAEAAPPPG